MKGDYMKKIFIVCTLLCTTMFLDSCNGSFGLDAGKAFRTSAELVKEPLYIDNEAIALSDSASDTGLRSIALEANNLVNEERVKERKKKTPFREPFFSSDHSLINKL